MKVEEKLTDDEDETCNDEVGEIKESSKSNSILERYLVDSIDALQIEKETTSETEDFVVENPVKTDVNKEENIEVAETDEVGSIPEIPVSVCKKSRAGSLRSVSTIPPEEVKQRIKKENQKEQKRIEKKRLTVKGEASAVNRKRRENMDTVKQYSVFNEW